MIDVHQRPSQWRAETGVLIRDHTEETPMRTTAPVLIMERDLDISQLLTVCLKLEGYRVQWCREKQDVLAWIEESTEPCSVLLLDLSMPCTACESLVNEIQRSHQRRFWSVPPIIGLTTSIEVYQSFSHPAVIHTLIKPFHLRQLRDLINGGQKTA